LSEEFVEVRLRLRRDIYDEIKEWMRELDIEEIEDFVKHLLNVFKTARHVYLELKEVVSY
jgi:uncharacterized protein YdaT